MTATVLLYSDDPQVRESMRLAIGPRPGHDCEVEFVEADSYDSAVRLLDEDDVDLLVLDGEAAPTGGLAIARQIKDEVDDCPPTCVMLARAADRWLAAYARCDATLMYPLDPVITARTVTGLLRRHGGGEPVNR